MQHVQPIWQTRTPHICCSMPQTPWIGIPGGRRRLDAARRQNKPIFLSIGYSACHWCHVMERESFEDVHTAELLNSNFIAIKVDREQRPDLDSIYMQASQALTGSGGWPLSVFLTPDLRPFYAGTYFPPVRRHNLPAFTDVLLQLARAWKEAPADVESVASQVLARIVPGAPPAASVTVLPGSLQKTPRLSSRNLRPRAWGWGRAPKFPQPMAIDFLLRRAVARRVRTRTTPHCIALHALKAMARGGMYDVVGGGFSRYSTDDSWRVPHFEKMLYDNAQLALAYLHAWQLTGDAFYKRIVVDTLDFVIAELTTPRRIYSSLDADSEGEEGKFYTWTRDGLRQALADDLLFELFVAAYGVTSSGNWDGKTVLQRGPR